MVPILYKKLYKRIRHLLIRYYNEQNTPVLEASSDYISLENEEWEFIIYNLIPLILFSKIISSLKIKKNTYLFSYFTSCSHEEKRLEKVIWGHPLLAQCSQEENGVENGDKKKEKKKDGGFFSSFLSPHLRKTFISLWSPDKHSAFLYQEENKKGKKQILKIIPYSHLLDVDYFFHSLPFSKLEEIIMKLPEVFLEDLFFILNEFKWSIEKHYSLREDEMSSERSYISFLFLEYYYERIIREEEQPFRKKRKRGGTYNTPLWLSYYLSSKLFERTVLGFLQKEGETSLFSLFEEGKETDKTSIIIQLLEKILPSLTICDPAMGTGNLLMGSLFFLTDFYKKLYCHLIKGLSFSSLIQEDSPSINHTSEHFILSSNIRDLKDYYSNSLAFCDNPSFSFWIKSNLLRKCLYGADTDASSLDISIMSFYSLLLYDFIEIPEEEGKILFKEGFHQHLFPPLVYRFVYGNSLTGIMDIYEKINKTPKENIKKAHKELEQYLNSFIEKRKRKASPQTFLQLRDLITSSLSSLHENYSSHFVDKSASKKCFLDILLSLRVHLIERIGIEGVSKNSKELMSLLEYIDGMFYSLIEEYSNQEKNEIKNQEAPPLYWQWSFPSQFSVFSDDSSFKGTRLPPELNFGFTIIIANPPYGNILSKEEKERIKSYYKDVKDISLVFGRRFLDLLKPGGSLGVVITYAITFHIRFSFLRNLLAFGFEKVSIATFDRDKCRIFRKMTQSVSLLICEGFFLNILFEKHLDNINKRRIETHQRFPLSLRSFLINSLERPSIPWPGSQKILWSTRMFRDLPSFSSLSYFPVDDILLGEKIGVPPYHPHRFPKIDAPVAYKIIKKLESYQNSYLLLDRLIHSRKPITKEEVSLHYEKEKKASFLPSFYIRSSGNYWYNAWTRPPYWSSEIKHINLKEGYGDLTVFPCLLINSSLFYFWFRVYSDGRHMNKDIMNSFPLPCSIDDLRTYLPKMEELYKRIEAIMFRYFDPKRKCFLSSKIKPYLDLLDVFLELLYKLSREEGRFIREYDNIIRGKDYITDEIYQIMIRYFSFSFSLQDKMAQNLLDQLFALMEKNIRI